ncbi:hypothetical protein J6590_000877 [Homalodisca vitripennis]|nr:hypothetical protein J6590_000874 [Homalodisca vitripennis]KAG8328220.1 hypothetical protein J6590_000877 [Homalodisca vitripennis]
MKKNIHKQGILLLKITLQSVSRNTLLLTALKRSATCSTTHHTVQDLASTRILLALVAAACADPILLNYPYEGASTYVPETRAAVIPAAYQYNYPVYDSVYRSFPYQVAAKTYYPAAAPVVTPEGYLADTPEVAAAKAFHFTQHVKALARN